MVDRFTPNLGKGHIQNDAKKLDIGWMGRLFGSVTEKPGNIAGFAMIVFSLLFAYFLIFGTDAPSLSKKDGLTLIGGFISLTLGFIFGRSTSQN